MADASWSRQRLQRSYRGPTREDCLRQQAADAVQARAAGYVPVLQQWTVEAGEQVYNVVYEQQLGALAGTGAYPISVRIDRDRTINRLWGIPLLGFLVRVIVLIPQFVILWLYGVGTGLALLVLWIPVLVNGRVPGWGFALIGGYIRLSTRVAAYLLLLAIPYPGLGTGPSEALDVTFDSTQRVNNLWGIPFIGLWVRGIALIPSAIALWFVGVAALLLSLVTWIPVLLFGRYPAIGYDIVGGYLRWSARSAGWFLMLAGPYPPFRLSE